MSKTIYLFVFSTLLFTVASCIKEHPENKQPEQKSKFGLVIHGGAGSMSKEKMSEERIAEYHATLEMALKKGYEILKNGGSCLDAVEAAVNLMEDSPIFNAGKGAVFTASGKNELDAAIMDGSTLNAGTVAGLTKIKNPISLARLVMENSKHVMMIGEGAELFAKEQGIEMVTPDYFFVQKRWDSLQRAKKAEEERKSKNKGKDLTYINPDHKYGTVGCVALDQSGNLAAATSTGGMTNKKYGRVGDVPIIGAGTYANNKTCAISATGHGEYFIRNVVSHDISSLIGYKNYSLDQAAKDVVMKKLLKQDGRGGVIGIDQYGNITMTFNTLGMHRGYMLDDGKPHTYIFKTN